MKIEITFFAFDLLHVRHIKILEDAKKWCDDLIYVLQTAPTFVVERYIQLKGSGYVNTILPYATEQGQEGILYSFKIDTCIIGDAFRERDFVGRQYCEGNEIELYSYSRDHRFSSSEVRKMATDRVAVS